MISKSKTDGMSHGMVTIYPPYNIFRNAYLSIFKLVEVVAFLQLPFPWVRLSEQRNKHVGVGSCSRLGSSIYSHHILHICRQIMHVKNYTIISLQVMLKIDFDQTYYSCQVPKFLRAAGHPRQWQLGFFLSTEPTLTRSITSLPSEVQLLMVCWQWDLNLWSSNQELYMPTVIQIWAA